MGRIWITGSHGMVGKNLIESQEAEKHEVITSTKGQVDLLNKKDIENWLRLKNPDAVIHAAGKVGGIQANIENPSAFIYENTILGLNLVNACKNFGVKSLLNLGSSCMYPKHAENPLSEESILTGSLEPTNEGYALAKICTQRFCEYISNEDKSNHYKTIIPCNIYGKYDNFSKNRSHLIPSIVRKLYEATKSSAEYVEVWGAGDARREFMYASDLADGIWFAFNNIKRIPSSINIGLGYDYSIIEYYKFAAEVIGFKGKFRFNLKKPEGMKQKLVKIDKITSLGWQHSTSIKDGIEMTYNYYLKNCIDD